MAHVQRRLNGLDGSVAAFVHVLARADGTDAVRTDHLSCDFTGHEPVWRPVQYKDLDAQGQADRRLDMSITERDRTS